MSNNKGTVAEQLAIAQMLLAGFDVFVNVCPNGNSDLIIIGPDAKVSRVQVKAFYRNHGRLVADTRSTARGTNRHKHYSGLVDLMAFVDTETFEVFLTHVPKEKTRIGKRSLIPFKVVSRDGIAPPP